MPSWDEYQAIVRRPASFLDADKVRELGYVLEAGPIGKSPDEAQLKAEKGSEESLASVVGMRHRIVQAEEWTEIVFDAKR